MTLGKHYIISPNSSIFSSFRILDSPSHLQSRSLNHLLYGIQQEGSHHRPSHQTPAIALAGKMAPSPKIELAPLSKAERDIAISQSQRTPMPTPFGLLFLVPPEIRLKIYRELITAGSVGFLETSKAVHNEAIDILLQERICKLEFNVEKPCHIFPSQESANTILNLEIRLNLTDRPPRELELSRICISGFNNWLDRISGGAYGPHDYQAPTHPTCRKVCKILLDCDPGFEGYLPAHIFEIMRFFTGFETLVLAIDNYYVDSTHRMRQRTYDPRSDPRRNMESATHSKGNVDTQLAYQTARDALEPTLGPAEWVCDEEGAHLEFHPRR